MQTVYLKNRSSQRSYDILLLVKKKILHRPRRGKVLDIPKLASALSFRANALGELELG